MKLSNYVIEQLNSIVLKQLTEIYQKSYYSIKEISGNTILVPWYYTKQIIQEHLDKID